MKQLSNTLESTDQSAELFINEDKFQASFLTNKGGRKENQDAFAITKTKDGTWVFCVADGLGGHKGGKLASQIAISAICEFCQSEKFNFFKPLTFRNAFQQANDKIVEGQKDNPQYAKMKSTLVVLLVKNNLAIWGHVGDVRLYLFRDDKIFHQTKDQSVPQMLVDSGEISQDEIRTHPERSSLLNSLGNTVKKVNVVIPISYCQLSANDFFNLSSDGFWENILEKDMINILNKSENMEKASMEMYQHILSNITESEYDNLTALNLKIIQSEKNLTYWHKTKYIEVRK